jgi:Putative DNA-binding domain
VPPRFSRRLNAPPVTPMLLELQRALRASLIERDDRDASAYVVPDGLTPGQRLAVYRNTFVGALTNTLRLAFPAVHRLVGTEFFEGAARTFIEERPPRSACLNDYGTDFPEFLADFPPAAFLAYLAEVARLEWAVNRALHAPDAERLDPARLAELNDDERARVRFLLHPSLDLLRAKYPVDTIWRAVLERDDAALAALDLASGRVWLLIERQPTGVGITRMSESAWRFTADLCAGRALYEALAEVGDAEAPALLANHLATGRFIEFRITAPAET